jgi:hypothetical protein
VKKVATNNGTTDFYDFQKLVHSKLSPNWRKISQSGHPGMAPSCQVLATSIVQNFCKTSFSFFLQFSFPSLFFRLFLSLFFLSVSILEYFWQEFAVEVCRA